MQSTRQSFLRCVLPMRASRIRRATPRMVTAICLFTAVAGCQTHKIGNQAPVASGTTLGISARYSSSPLLLPDLGLRILAQLVLNRVGQR